ncbi:unnamed protein product [Cladocopium goreaui]|uniref:Uncharacterized protein n=1 Tax=Cladocopium goreaui TaxID=2562237 RepID=A0A9P1FEY1_9DINO|nr:unnamed protein product [Cladocopium goreaui]
MDFDDECADEELQVAGNDHDDPPQQEDASRRKRRRFTSNSGSGRDAVKTCFVASCSETCAKGKKWCATHNSFYDSMSYHAKKNKETEIFNQVMSDALEADRAFKRFMDDNPDQGRWSRKKFIEWSQFKKEHSLSLVHTDRRGAKPFEKKKSSSRVETSAAEKHLGDDDRELMLDQVMKGGTPNDVDDRFFTEAVGVKIRTEKMQLAAGKIKEAQEKLSKSLGSQQDACGQVVASYNTMLQACENICKAWLDSLPSEALKLAPKVEKKEIEEGDDYVKPEVPDAVEQKHQHFLQLVKNAEPQIRLCNGDLELISLVMLEFYQHLLSSASSPAWLVAFESECKSLWSVQDVFQKSLVRISTDVLSYISQKERTAARNQERKRKEDESRAAKTQRAQAKAHAAMVKQAKAHGHAVFGVDDKLFQSFADRSPWVWKGCESCKSWRNHPNVSLRLSEFGGSYKQAASFKADGRSQAPILRNQGKQESDILWSSVFPSKSILDITKIPEGTSFMQNCWWFGYDPKNSWAHFAPNGAGMIRCIASGQMRIICFPVADVQETMRAKGMTVNLDELTQFVLSLTKEDPLVGKGYAVNVSQDDVVYIPPGMILCEKSSSSALLYGGRKSYILKNEDCMQSYQGCIDMLKASSRDPSKMESVVELYKTVTSMPPPPVPQKAQAEKVLEPGDLNSKKVTEDRGDGNDALRLARFKSLVAGGLHVYSDYSGMAGEFEALFQLGEALASRVEFEVSHRRFCDISKLAQGILKEISSMEFNEPCVMSDINSRLPEHALRWLNAAEPAGEDSAEAAASSYGSMDMYLKQNRKSIFADATHDWCIVHNRRCELFPQVCGLYDDECDDGFKQPLVINFAGTTCKGWSAVGKGRCFSDPSERPHSIWTNERGFRASETVQSQETMFFSECTPRYPVKVRCSFKVQSSDFRLQTL